MKWRRLVFWIVTSYSCFIITILIITNRIQSQKEEITVMSNAAQELESELFLANNQNESYQLKILDLQDEINRTSLENNQLKKEKNDLLEQINSLKSNNLLSEQTIRKLELEAKSSSVILEEKETFIAELNERLSKYGGFDIYDLPLRSKVYEDFTIWLEDGAHESYADLAMSYIDQLPDGFLKEFNNNGWAFIITTRNLESVYQSKTLNTVGLTIYSKKRIYLVNQETHIADAVIHEFGHAMDSLCGHISLKGEWIEIYNEEKSKSNLSNYFISDPREYFAETMQQYFTFKSVVRKNTPKSYKYIENLLKKYK